MRRSSPLFSSVRHARPRRGRSFLRYATFAVVGIVVLGLAVAVFLWRYADSKIKTIEPEVLQENKTDPAAPQEAVPGTLNVLVVGSDSREGLSDAQLQQLGTEDIGTNLTDTIMLVQLSPVREHAVVVSFPRDLRVDPPGEVGAVKINSVQERGGPDLLIRTIQDLTGVPIDHYVEVNIAGFLRLADAVGGVEVCLDQPLKDVDSAGNNFTGLDLPAGCQTIDDVTAVRFVRARHDSSEQFGTGDFGRIAKQQYFLSQAMKKVTSAGTLLNPLKVKRLIDAVAGSVTTDRDLGITTMYRIANSMKSIQASDLETHTVPGYSARGDDGQWYVYMYPEKAEQLFQSLRDGSDPGDVGLAAPQELAPKDVSVLVVNGVGTEGLAGDMSDFLTTAGFNVAGAVNPSDVDPTQSWDPQLETLTITYPAALEAKAKLLESHLGDVPVDLVVSEDPIPEGADVMLTVGSAWTPAPS